nr:MAG TPA: hypothetical protein [Caudoviricetes sp.]
MGLTVKSQYGSAAANAALLKTWTLLNLLNSKSEESSHHVGVCAERL